MSSPSLPVSDTPEPPAERTKAKRIPWMRMAVGAVMLVLAAAAGYWFFVLRFEQSTDDAYVGGNVTVMAPKVDGFITDILVQDNQRVKANQVLIRLDSRDYDAKLAQATAEVASARAAVTELQAQQVLQAAVINQHQAEVRASSAELTRSGRTGRAIANSSRTMPFPIRSSSVRMRTSQGAGRRAEQRCCRACSATATVSAGRTDHRRASTGQYGAGSATGG